MLLPSWSYEGNDSAPDSVYRKILGFCKIDFNHLTHLRSSAIEQASTWGLDVFRIATMSKHLIDKINRFYMSESNRDVLSMMSGFREKHDQYYVPCTHIQVPFSHKNDYVSHVFPRYKPLHLHWFGDLFVNKRGFQKVMMIVHWFRSWDFRSPLRFAGSKNSSVDY